MCMHRPTNKPWSHTKNQVCLVTIECPPKPQVELHSPWTACLICMKWAVRLSWLQNSCSCPLFGKSISTRKVGQTGLVFRMPSGFVSSLGLCARLQVCVSSGPTVTIYFTLINIQTDTHTDRQHFNQFIWKAQPAELKTAIFAPTCILGIPVRTTLDNSTTVQYAGLLNSLAAQARNCVRDIDPQNDLTFLRVRSKKNEIMVAPGMPVHVIY